MNRDALLATIIGFGIGLLIMGVLLIGPSLAKNLPTLTLPNISSLLPQRSQPTPTPSVPSSPTSLSIDSPLSEAIHEESTLLVSGSAPAGSVVVIAGYEDETVVRANGDHKYAGKVTLAEGKNELLVTNYQDGKVLNQSIVVYYTPEEF